MPTYGHRLVDDLLDLDRGDSDGERGAEHDPVLGEGLGGDHRRELHHQPGPGVEVAVAQALVEGEVVEVLDQLRVGDGQRRDVAGEQLVVVLLRLGARHESDPPLWTDETDGDLVGGGAVDGADGPGPVAVVLGVVGGVDRVASTSGSAPAKATSRSMPPARMRPVPLARACRYQGRSGPPADGRTGRRRRGRPTSSCTGAASRPRRREASSSSVASPTRRSSSSLQARSQRTHPDQRLDGAALVHRRVGVGDVVEVGLVVEDQAGVDACRRARRRAARGCRCGPARGRRASRRCGRTSGANGHLAVRDADDADGGAGPGDRRTRCRSTAAVPTHSRAASTPMPPVSSQDGCVGLVAAGLDDVGGAELAGELAGGRRGGSGR